MPVHTTPLQQQLRHAAAQQGRAFGMVVHLGAGANGLDEHLPLGAEQLVLVEGDPEVAADLHSRAEHSGARVEVISTPVAPAAGPVIWHRYNLRSLSGPRGIDGLRTWYPRLQEISALPLQAVGLAELLAAVLPPVAEDNERQISSRLLIIDVPGQEADLLGNVDATVLRRFGWVLLHGWRAATDATQPLERSVQRLSSMGFVHFPTSTADDAILTYALFRFNEAHHALHAEVERLNRAVAEFESQLQATRAEQQKRAHVDAARINELSAAREALLKRVAELEAASERLTKQTAQHAAECDAQVKAVAEQRALVQDRQRRIEQLVAEMTEAQFRMELLQQELLKAEGQLEVVKDLLLNEPTL